MNVGGWRQPAACRNSDPVVFFPSTEPVVVRIRGSVSQQVSRAQEICSGCPVTEQCYEFAKAGGERIGVWGGVWFERDAPTPTHWFIAPGGAICSHCNSNIPAGAIMKSDGTAHQCRSCVERDK